MNYCTIMCNPWQSYFTVGTKWEDTEYQPMVDIVEERKEEDRK